MTRVVFPASICCLCRIPRKPSQDVRHIVRDKPTMGCKGGVTYFCLGGGDKEYECKLGLQVEAATELIAGYGQQN